MMEWYHLDGTVCVAGHDAATARCVEGHGPVMAPLIWQEVQRLQRFEAMWQDCRQHRDNAERRARRLQQIVTQVADLVAPPEFSGGS